MSNLIQYLPPFLSAFVICSTFAAVLRKLSLKYNLVSKPRDRDTHTKPVPRIGGLAIFVAFLIVSLLWFLVIQPSLRFSETFTFNIDRKLLGIWLGSLVIAVFMLIDDIKGVKAIYKLVVQILVAIIVIASGVGINSLANPFGQTLNLNSVYIQLFSYGGIPYHFSLWSDLLTLIWLVGMMNVLNFIDGIDGLAAGISGISAVVIFLLSVAAFVNQPATALLAIILAGSAFGFLPLNFYPAKIFMGDSGSMFLGLMLGTLTLITGGKLATVFLVLGFVIVDGLVVSGGRLLRGKNPMTTPDKTHLHHRFIEAGFSVRQAVLIMYLISALFGWVALRGTTMVKLEAGGVLVTCLLMLIWGLGKMKKNKS